MKGIFKGFIRNLSLIFVVKEREMEIGHPTDVKHVAHIGWEAPSRTGSAPSSWMSEFKMGSESGSPWSSRDFGESMRQQSVSFTGMRSPELPRIKKKEKRKKSKSTSSPKSIIASCSSRTGKSKSKLIEGGSNTANIQVA